jgi:hypothetical protein
MSAVRGWGLGARVAAAIGSLCAWLALAPAASAEITQVFGETESPVSCRVQSGANEGIRFCSNFDGAARSTVPSPVDGVPLDVNVAFPPAPADGPDGPYPLVMMFHGYGGSKIGLGSMRRWLDQGYATFSMTDRGFNQSCGNPASRAADPDGCAKGYIRLIDDRYEVRDAQEFAGLLVDEGLADPNAIGATGGSYGGGMSMALAALNDRVMEQDDTLIPWESPAGTPLHIAAAAPEVPWTDLAYALTPNGSALDYTYKSPYLGASGRIGIQKQAWVTNLYLAGLVTGFYAPEGSDPSADITGWNELLNTGGPYDGDPRADDIIAEITGHHSSYYIDHTEPPAPLTISNGFTDDLFPATEALRFYNRTRTQYPNASIALTFGDFGHQRGANKPDILGTVGARENAWFAYYLKGEGAPPPNDVVAGTQTCPTTAPSGGPYEADSWADMAPGEVRLNGGKPQTIAKEGTQYGEEYGNYSALSGGDPCVHTDGADNPKTANYRLPAAPAGGYTMMGSATVVAKFALPGENSQVAARLFDVDPVTNQETLVARGLWRPEVSGRKAVRQVFQLTPNGWNFAEGHVPKLELLPDDAPYGRASPGQKAVAVSNLQLRVPVLESPGSLDGVVKKPAPKVLLPGYQFARGFDEGPPDTRISKGPKPKTHGRSVRFQFSASDVGSTFECKLDGKSFAPCKSSKRYSGLRRGKHTFQVRAIDPDDNKDPSPAQMRFRVAG